ncbi:MAG: 50S ribosomal protein L24 [Firmicutes bacterium]|uniref:Large ribosomal subunit protein uL24 n=1 Tax=Candidatus Gallilactobacillus intestinavium TaxID=2840838 RepID=A0A9D9H971_9LACO|nr:50S ribosomal protein L24 [Candidatus Gallilactobacillus intestinavium]
MLLKTGDKVRVIAGKDKGKEGTIKQILSKTNRVVVDGVNKIKKHQKPNDEYPQGGIVDVEAPIHASNVMILDPKTNEPTRIGVKIEKDKKIRVARKTGNKLD